MLAWRNAVAVIFALSGLTFASYIGRLPQVRDDLQATTLQVALLTFGLAVGSVVGLVGSGRWQRGSERAGSSR